MTAGAVGAFGLAIALGTSACGTGQVSQTTSQEPAVNGGSAKIGALLIRDVTFVWPGDDAEAVHEAGGPYDISFLISNQSSTVVDKPGSITPPRGTVTLTGDATVNPGKALHAGTPDGLLTDEGYAPKTGAPSSAAATSTAAAPSSAAPEADEADERLTATLTGAGDTVRAGVSTQLIFTFEKAGEVRILVPLNGGDLARQDKIRPAESAH